MEFLSEYIKKEAKIIHFHKILMSSSLPNPFKSHRDLAQKSKVKGQTECLSNTPTILCQTQTVLSASLFPIQTQTA